MYTPYERKRNFFLLHVSSRRHRRRRRRWVNDRVTPPPAGYTRRPLSAPFAASSRTVTSPSPAPLRRKSPALSATTAPISAARSSNPSRQPSAASYPPSPLHPPTPTTTPPPPAADTKVPTPPSPPPPPLSPTNPPPTRRRHHTISMPCFAPSTPRRRPNRTRALTTSSWRSRWLAASSHLCGGGDAKPEAPAVSEGGVGNNEDKWPSFDDLGGMEQVIEQLLVEVVVPLCSPELPHYLGVRPVSGLLLHGPPGCGKTTLAHAIANETGVPFYKISAPDIVSGVSGGSEENIRGLFQKAYRTAPSIVFIDEIDAIASKRENLQREMERRIVTQLMTCMDEFHQNIGGDDSEADSSAKKPGHVIVIGATNRPDAVDQALRRPGRFDREIYLGVPDVNSRKQILMMLARKLRLEGQFDFLKVARATPGFVGADLKSLVNNAGYLAMNRIINKRRVQYCFENGAKVKWWKQQFWDAGEMEYVTMNDFEDATKLVQPTLRREGFSSVPEVTWDDVGGLDTLRKEFRRYIRCIKSPEDCDVFGVRMQDGFLLFGPPGCGKTLIAQAMAHEAGANFIHIKGPELLNKYVGESESEIRKIFNRARTNAPCIVFFDELDALATKRGKEGGWVVERLLNQLLVELDGVGQRKGVYVIGATNRIDVIDDAILRPGRLGKKHYVPIPGARERVSILKAHARHTPISSTVDLDVLALREACNNFTGADLASLVNEAAMLAVEERWRLLDNGTSVSPSRLIELSHFEQALSKVKPSVSKQQREHYETLREEYLSTT
ncbi:hypothetical protein HU200_005354 [Digitaria exilis]|uniref:AAA+ ATPase domain-containing protein n=1 Tax=Digitaria exilis TaxID=1010633 RepID=A0A835KT51_9POAL|nr:hypothetical protein HU200_005354 [Digitaria exilis]